MEEIDGPPPTSGEGRKRRRCNFESNSDQSGCFSSKKLRHRSDSADPNMSSANSPFLKRDHTYYFDDGSCIFLVEDTLFKVHRTRLRSCDSSSFGTMFSLPQGNLDVEGQSDENPVVLTGDTASEFRNFLWSLYALPPEVAEASGNLTKLIDIARVSHKYVFRELETWALNTIHEFVNRKPSPILSASNPPAFSFFGNVDISRVNTTSCTVQNAEDLTKLIRLAQLCNHEKLLTTMINHLIQLTSTSLEYAYLAMTLADELDLRTLKGVAYLEVMQKAVVVKRTKTDIDLQALTRTTSSSGSVSETSSISGHKTKAKRLMEGEIDEHGRLVVSQAQQLRLLAGYYRLTSTWERLRVNPPTFDHAASCGATWHQHGCTQSWVEFWKEKTKIDTVTCLGLADVVGRLKQVYKEYERWGSAPYMHHDCRSAARKAIQDVIKKIEDGLPNFFSEDEYEYEDSLDLQETLNE